MKIISASSWRLSPGYWILRFSVFLSKLLSKLFFFEVTLATVCPCSCWCLKETQSLSRGVFCAMKHRISNASHHSNRLLLMQRGELCLSLLLPMTRALGQGSYITWKSSYATYVLFLQLSVFKSSLLLMQRPGVVHVGYKQSGTHAERALSFTKDT